MSKFGNIILSNEHYPELVAITQVGNSGMQLNTGSGYLQFGPLNTSHCHFQTDRPNFYFNKGIRVNTGFIDSYDEDLQLRRASSTSARLRITAGTTISDQPLSVTGVVTATGGNSGNWNTAYGWGNHASAGYLTSYTDTNTHTHLDTTDNRTISASEFAAGDLHFGFTSWANNNAGPYADFIHMRSYADSSGGNDNLLMFKKSGKGIRLWQSSFGSSSAYSSYVDIWDTGTLTTTNKANYDTAYGWGDHGTQSYATQSYVGTQISNLVDSSPGALNTLNELAAALGDDASFSTTVTNSIATKLPLAGGTLTGNLLLDVDNAEINLKSGVGTTSGAVNWTFNTTGTNYTSIKLPYATRASIGLHIDSGYPLTLDGTTSVLFAISGSNKATINNSGLTVVNTITASGGNSGNWNTAYGWGNHASAGYITTDTNTTYSAGTGLDLSGTTFNLEAKISPATATELTSSIDLDDLIGANAGFYFQTANADTPNNNYPTGEAGSLIVQKSAGNATQMYQTYTASPRSFFRSNYNAGWGAWREIWHSGNLTTTNKANYDTAYGWGNHASAGYTNNTVANAALPKAGGTLTGTLTTGGNIVVPSATGMSTSGDWIKMTTNHGYIQLGPANTSHAHIYTDRGSFYFNKNTLYANGNTMWTAGNDGSGSGLDADLLDGKDSTLFVSTHNGTNRNIEAEVGSLHFYGDGLNSGQSNHSYAIFQEAGAWSAPFPDLRIAYHTGIKLGAHSSYNGIRFYNDSDMATETFSVGNGDNHVRVAYNLYRGGNTVWDAGNDGAGSGLDADLLDGQQGSYYAPATGGSYRSSTGNFEHIGRATNTNYNNNSGSWGARLQVTDTQHAKINVSQEANGMISHWYAHTGHDSIKFGTESSHDVEFQRGGVTKLELTSTGVVISDTLTVSGTTNARDVKISAGYHLQRSDHHSGHLEGSYNNIGGNGSKTNPIYTIGSSYNPASTTLGNMYGIGYTDGAASFISGTAFNGWGMYVAADGDARVFLSGANGTVASTGQHYVGSNVVWNAGNDGAGSGLDADLLDGQHASAFQAAGSYLTTEANLFIGDGGSGDTHPGTGRGLYTGQLSQGTAPVGMPTTDNSNSILTFNRHSGNYNSQIGFSSNSNMYYRSFSNVAINSTNTWRKVWDAGNDGAGSGLDADLLDGQQASAFAPIGGSTGRFVTGGLYGTGHGSSTLPIWQYNAGNPGYGIGYTEGSPDSIRFSVNNVLMSGTANLEIFPSETRVNGSAIWHAGNDGSGSGLDADLLDGLQLHTGTNNVANRVVRTQANGYIMAGWINTTSGTASGTISRIYCSQDGYIRYLSPASLAPSLANVASAAQIYTTQTAGTAGTHYPTFVSVNSSGNKALKYDPGMMYDPSTNTLGDVNFKFTGTLTGSSTSCTGNAATVTTHHSDGGGNYPIVWRSGATTYYTDEVFITASANEVNAYKYVCTAGTDNGIGFWGSTASYAIKMGDNQANHGTVTDYSMHFQMDASSGRGFTFGSSRTAVVASINALTGAILSSNNITAYSDIRVKDNIEVIPNALDKVKQLSGYTFTRTDVEDKEQKYTGVIAQEVLKVLPEAVQLGATEEDTMSVAYGNMVGLMIEAIKELKSEVDDLKTQLSQKQN